MLLFGLDPEQFERVGTAVEMKCFDALMLCLHKSPSLWDGWSILQELYDWHDYRTFTEASDFVEKSRPSC